VGETAIEEIVLARQFLVAPQWQQRGWCEETLWRWLTAREKQLADFAFPNGCLLSAPWKKIFRNLSIVVLAALLIGLGSPALKVWILGLGLFVTISQAIAQMLLTGRAFQPMHFSGVNIPLYTGYGVGFRELANLLFKCSIVQIPLLIPFST